ncbi:MAG: hypothetical protein RBT49_15850 [Bacteroidales bacterium]|jgi:hypothetical protein|nr:hypothetical protein [Bacteroidales bacterium]
MATMTIEYDKRNKAAMKIVEFIKEIGLFRIKENDCAKANSVTESAIKEADSKNLKKHSSVKSLMAELNK